MHGSKENGLYFCTDNSGCSRALFGAVWFIIGHNGTTENSALGGIYGSNRVPLVLQSSVVKSKKCEKRSKPEN
jgi:hypothetical protein